MSKMRVMFGLIFDIVTLGDNLSLAPRSSHAPEEPRRPALGNDCSPVAGPRPPTLERLPIIRGGASRHPGILQ